MTPSEDVQKAIVDALKADADVSAIVGVNVIDGDRPIDADCICFGPVDIVYEDYDCITLKSITVQIDCWVGSDGRQRPARACAEKVAAALHDVDLPLSEYGLVRLSVGSVRAMIDQDGLSGHGIVSVTAEVE